MYRRQVLSAIAGSFLIAAASVAVGAAPASATPISCHTKKVNSTTGSASCSGGSGTVRVVVRCVDNFSGTSSTQYGPYVGIGATSTHQCYPAQRSSVSYVDYQTRG